MKHLAKIAVAAALAFGLAACGTNPDGTQKTFAQWSQGFQTNLGIFNQDIDAVDATLANVNAKLYSQCNSFVQVSQAINDLSGQCSKAAPYTSVANSIVDNYCQTSALASNGGIVTSIGVTASSISAAKSQLAANKKACAAGG